ncbi:hypothetical protein BsWGS_16287 [Bradybaena similaris]
MDLRTTKEAARFGTKEFSMAPTTRHVTFLLCIVSLMYLNTVTLANSGESVGQYHPRFKRNLFQLCAVIIKYTVRDCEAYNGYGKYCGWGGSGEPVDAVDRCCRSHDQCYGRVSSFFCYPKLVTYRTPCKGNNCSCTDSSKICAYKTCRCDVEFGQCLKSAPYNPKHKH